MSELRYFWCRDFSERDGWSEWQIMAHASNGEWVYFGTEVPGEEPTEIGPEAILPAELSQRGTPRDLPLDPASETEGVTAGETAPHIVKHPLLNAVASMLFG